MRCPKCVNGETNWWGYNECWKYNQTIDSGAGVQTADREKTAMRLEGNGKCEHFEKRPFFERMKQWMKMT